MVTIFYFFSFIIFATIISQSSSQILETGNCPKVNVTDNFSLPQFLGKWHEVRAFPYFYTLGSSCISWTFIQNDDGTLNVEVRQSQFDVEEVEIGNCEISRPGVILISYPNSIVTRADADYHVLSTDYENYAVLFTCTNAFFVNAQNAWILSRKSILDDRYLEKAKATLDEQGISSSLLGITLPCSVV